LPGEPPIHRWLPATPRACSCKACPAS
jgi:hypothetical protein